MIFWDPSTLSPAARGIARAPQISVVFIAIIQAEDRAMGSKLLTAVVCLAAMASIGCAKWDQMAPQSVHVTNKHLNTVAITTNTQDIWSGGGHAFVMGDGVGEHMKEFNEALEKTIVTNQIFSAVKKPGESDYSLDVRLTNVSQPVFGVNLDASMDATWTLRASSGNAIVWQDHVSGKGRATIGDGFAAVERARKAIMRAAADHIQHGVEAMSQAQFSQIQVSQRDP
jgi:hypothetical protein